MGAPVSNASRAVEIVDRKKFREVLDRATRKTEQLASEVPDWEIPHIALPQLALMRELADQGRAPSDDEKKRINIGQIAAKNLEDIDDEYAGWLEELDFAFRRYDGLP